MHEDQPALSYLEKKQSERPGKVDRFFDDSFSLVKSGSAPTRGVYLSDRLRVVCYAFCLEEMFGKPLYGSVEYLSSGTIRSVVAVSGTTGSRKT